LTVFPLFHNTANGPEYITLEEALEQNLIDVEEISESGSVPDLKVTNRSPEAVLLLDGEEVAGAKQNRLINSSIFIRNKKHIVIPVSCSESGRWRYTSSKFRHSGHVSPYTLRSSKMASVLRSLQASRGHRADQSEVWNEIDGLHGRAGTSSPTHAMRDMYEQKEKSLEDYKKAFEKLPGQRGCVVCLGDEVVSVETISKEDAFGRAFDKIVQSFAVEAVSRKDKPSERPDHEVVEAFLDEVRECKEDRHDSVGEGHDYRYESKDLVGSVLVVDDSVVHATIFRLGGDGTRGTGVDEDEFMDTGDPEILADDVMREAQDDFRQEIADEDRVRPVDLDKLDDLDPKQKSKLLKLIRKIGGLSPKNRESD
jgi:hypothetical protein